MKWRAEMDLQHIIRVSAEKDKVLGGLSINKLTLKIPITNMKCI